jgi:hypothetical protein
MSSRNLNFFARLAVAGIVIAAAGCAELGLRSNLSPEGVVRERAQAWADNLMAGNVEGAWALTSPSYRQFSTWQQYFTVVQGSGRWKSAKVDSVKCVEAEDVCDVRILIDYEVKSMHMTNQRDLEYKWVKVDGDWWLHVPAK